MLDRKIKVGFINWYSPTDRKALSGTPYKISELLKSFGCEIEWIRVRRNFAYRLLVKVLGILNKLVHTEVRATHTVWGAMLQSGSIDRKQIRNSRCDLLFAPMASECLYSLKTDLPIVYLSDTTFAAMVDYYFKNLPSWAIKQGNRVEKKNLDKASKIIVSSDWAAYSVIKDYHQSPSKVNVVEFGANIDDTDIIEKKYEYNGILHLLFLGVDWIRKGGDIAVDACRFLNDSGISAVLHIVGIKELGNDIKALPFVNYVGFLDKNVPEEYHRLIEVIKLCHCLLLPTLAECAGIAFCESSANGLPCFTHDTGGTSNYVYNGKNGYLLPLGSTGEDFGKKIKECLESGELERMTESARIVYKEKLNWNVWAGKVEKIVNNLINKKDAGYDE